MSVDDSEPSLWEIAAAGMAHFGERCISGVAPVADAIDWMMASDRIKAQKVLVKQPRGKQVLVWDDTGESMIPVAGLDSGKTQTD